MAKWILNLNIYQVAPILMTVTSRHDSPKDTLVTSPYGVDLSKYKQGKKETV